MTKRRKKKNWRRLRRRVERWPGSVGRLDVDDWYQQIREGEK